MTVEPGISGQPMIKSCLNKVKTLADMRAKNKYSFLIGVDGGIDNLTGQLAVNKRANILISGGYVQQLPFRIEALRALKKTSQ